MFEKISGTRIAQIFCGSGNCFDITADSCFLNGVDLVKIPDKNQFASIVSMLITSACTVPQTDIKVKKNPSYSDALKGLVDNLSKSDQVKIQVLDAKPDEMTDNKPVEAKFSLHELDEFRDNLKVYASCFEDILSLTDVLLKMKLPKNVRGFKELTKIITTTKTATEEMMTNKEQYEIVAEQLDGKIGQVILLIKRNGSIGKLLRPAIDQVINNFGSMKKYSTEILYAFNPLYNVDHMFKKYTEYPATWYFEPSVFYNFTERYKDASDHLIEMAHIESSIIRPLHDWQKLF